MSEDLVKLIEAAVYLLVAVAGAFLTPIAHKWLAARAGEANTNRILDWADTFVQMAEQKMAADGGEGKYQYVFTVLRAIADRDKIKVDDNSLEAAIEAAVYQLKTGQAAAKVPAAVGNVVVAPAAQVTTDQT